MVQGKPAMDLYDYQGETVSKISANMRRGIRRQIIVGVTGSGKTEMAAYMLHKLNDAGHQWNFVVHRKELLDQASRTFKKWGIDHGFIAAGRPQHDHNIMLCSIDTLRSRIDSVREPDGWVVDECHRSSSPTYLLMFNRWRNSRCIGLTGTPTRLDGKPLDMYEDMVIGPRPRELMDMNRLAPYRMFRPPCDIDFSSVPTGSNGDYQAVASARAMDNGAMKVYGRSVELYLEHCPGERAISLCLNIEHAELACQQFREAGIPAACIHGKLSHVVRNTMLDAYRDGNIKVLTSVNLLYEGLDVPGIVAVFFQRRTKSLVIYLQGWGRAWRYKGAGNHALMFDMVGNLDEPGMGLPCDEREWTLKGKKKGKKKDEPLPPEITVCPKHYEKATRLKPCQSTDSAGNICGWMPPVQERKIEEVAGDLVEIDIAAKRMERKSEESSAQTLEQLIALGKARGYKPGWARHRFNARKWRQRAAR